MSATKDTIKDTTPDEATEKAKEGGNYVASTSLNEESTSDDKEKTANIRANAAQDAEDDSMASWEKEKEKEKKRPGNPAPDNNNFEVIKETSWYS